MKKFKNTLAVTALSLGMGSLALAQTRTVLTPSVRAIPVDHVFAPDGFDTNDDTQVIVTGYLPNLCYKSPKASQQVLGKTIDVRVQALYDMPPGTMCLQAIVPFMEAVSVGVLDKGTYNIKVNEGTPSSKAEQIKVVESSSSAIDDHVYAAVDFVETFPGSRTIRLKGYNPSDCFELDQIKMVSNKKDTFAVLPILKQVREACPMKMVPFEYEATVPNELDAETLLLHVRVMNGRSVNALFQNR